MPQPRDDPETEARLQDAARGDQQALHWLLEHHRARLRRMISVRLDDRLSSRLDPSDIVQETLIDAVRKLDAYVRDRPLPFYPWLHRLASERLTQIHRNNLRASRRAAGREQPRESPGAGTTSSWLVDVLAASATSPSKQLIREEERERVRRALDSLPDQDREVLVLRYLDQLAFGEIAALLTISESAARVRHYRALRRLEPLLETRNEGPEP